MAYDRTHEGQSLVRSIISGSPTSHKRIAFCGTRGVPANYGGFETAVDEISRRFVDGSYACDVFCRTTGTTGGPSTHAGRNLVYVKGSRNRKLDTFVSAVRTGWYLLKNRSRYSHVFWFNNANLPGILMTRLAGIPTTVNTDGLEWRRAKWAWPFKLYYFLSTALISVVCPSLVSDSYAIQAYYRRTFRSRTNFIPYGAPDIPKVSRRRQDDILRNLNLEAGKYFLQITRIEPDNLPLNVVEAFHNTDLGRRDMKMVVVGYKDSTAYAQRLIAYDGRHGIQVRNATYDQDVLFTLRSNCHCYVHGNSVGGTNPALLEAMATCPRIMAIDCEFSHEVLGATGRYFDRHDIEPTFRTILEMEDQSVAMRERVDGFYQWDAVAESYARLAEGWSADYPEQLEKTPRSTGMTVQTMVVESETEPEKQVVSG
ncbi:MAG: DUF1972 domain-containing protein [candidate division Zixibacteria bacterium]|nr:DUF1972 domain-containing protein [candidate division Zixibacteria bacterium]